MSMKEPSFAADTPVPRLYEVTAVGRHLERMDSKISDLMAKTKSIQTDIAGFQDRVEGMEQWFVALEDRRITIQDRDQELLLA
ncbi:hypothetical protein NDU88_007850 [Pleurodeles waltl]|uniref:Uncharacterized protein n=1 Tax=Pleurodeles waltl TaxID=8319 RepID=A0AAV7QQY5_PLEWA|nr:hypothetical protein NDU88_007850 [Pleurodeles waltl]